MDAPTYQPAAPTPRRADEMKMRDLKDCEKARSKAFLTPPGLIDGLCKGAPLQPVCREAIFAEELIEIAKELDCAHLVSFEKCDP